MCSRSCREKERGLDVPVDDACSIRGKKSERKRSDRSMVVVPRMAGYAVRRARDCCWST